MLPLCMSSRNIDDNLAIYSNITMKRRNKIYSSSRIFFTTMHIIIYIVPLILMLQCSTRLVEFCLMQKFMKKHNKIVRGMDADRAQREKYKYI